MREFRIFLWAVGSHWVAVLGSAAFVAYQLFADRWRVSPLPDPLFWSGMSACLLLACFLAWRDEYLVARAKKSLEIVFDPAKHLTEYGSGLRRYHIVVVNRGTTTIHRVSVRIKSIKEVNTTRPTKYDPLVEVPLVPLHEDSLTPQCEISLDPDPAGRIFNFVEQVGKGKSFEILHGARITEAVEGEDDEQYVYRFRHPDGRLYGGSSYSVEITALGQDVLPKDQKFALRPDKDKRLEVEAIREKR